VFFSSSSFFFFFFLFCIGCPALGFFTHVPIRFLTISLGGRNVLFLGPPTIVPSLRALLAFPPARILSPPTCPIPNHDRHSPSPSSPPPFNDLLVGLCSLCTFMDGLQFPFPLLPANASCFLVGPTTFWLPISFCQTCVLPWFPFITPRISLYGTSPLIFRPHLHLRTPSLLPPPTFRAFPLVPYPPVSPRIFPFGFTCISV